MQYIYVICTLYGIFTLLRHAAGQHEMCVHRFECVTDTSIVITSDKWCIYVMMYVISSCMVTFIINLCVIDIYIVI